VKCAQTGFLVLGIARFDLDLKAFENSPIKQSSAAIADDGISDGTARVVFIFFCFCL
jgi:hypothetical protein